jgi:glycosyltransferase involved in cell wall biosynthesis
VPEVAVPTRVAFVTNVLAHYRVPCFARLRDRMAGVDFFLLAGDMEHRSYVLAKGEAGSPSATVLKGHSWHSPPADDRHLNDIRPIVRGDYRVIVMGGWSEPTYLLLWLWAVLTKRKVVFWIESTALETRRGGFAERVKHLLLRKATACIVPGRRAAEYCHSLGMENERVFIAPNAADRAWFSGKATRLAPERDRLRGAEKLTQFTILFVGRLVDAYKDVSTLLRSAGLLSGRGQPVTILLAGDGPDELRLRRLAAELRLGDARFLGRLNQEQLCRLYASADVLVLPSRSEPWGFVLNEGMEFGLPLVVSDAVGAGPDLVSEGENGFVFPVGHADVLADRLERLASDPALRARMGAASRRIIERFTPEAWAEGAEKAIRYAAGYGP